MMIDVMNREFDVWVDEVFWGLIECEIIFELLQVFFDLDVGGVIWSLEDFLNWVY